MPYIQYPNEMLRYPTSCCALTQVTMNNRHSLEQIKEIVERIKSETKREWNIHNRGGGERAIFVIATMPHEEILAQNLLKAGFKKVYSFARRNGYPEGYNDMWMISW